MQGLVCQRVQQRRISISCVLVFKCHETTDSPSLTAKLCVRASLDFTRGHHITIDRQLGRSCWQVGNADFCVTSLLYARQLLDSSLHRRLVAYDSPVPTFTVKRVVRRIILYPTS